MSPEQDSDRRADKSNLSNLAIYLGGLQQEDVRRLILDLRASGLNSGDFFPRGEAFKCASLIVSAIDAVKQTPNEKRPFELVREFASNVGDGPEGDLWAAKHILEFVHRCATSDGSVETQSQLADDISRIELASDLIELPGEAVADAALAHLESYFDKLDRDKLGALIADFQAGEDDVSFGAKDDFDQAFRKAMFVLRKSDAASEPYYLALKVSERMRDEPVRELYASHRLLEYLANSMEFFGIPSSVCEQVERDRKMLTVLLLALAERQKNGPEAFAAFVKKAQIKTPPRPEDQKLFTNVLDRDLDQNINRNMHYAIGIAILTVVAAVAVYRLLMR
jgi:hypothetical protein